jgi:DNA-binding transcriptional regulator YiaG
VAEKDQRQVAVKWKHEEFAADGKGWRLQENYLRQYTIAMQTKPFSNNLRTFRNKAGLRQIDVARLLNLDCADRLSRWENGSAMPNILNLFKLSALYKTAPQELYLELYRSIENAKPESAPQKPKY